MEEKLSQANIPETWWTDCFIRDDNMIFTPVFDDAGVMVKTGKQSYDELLQHQVVPAMPTPSPQDIINASVMARLAALEGDADV